MKFFDIKDVGLWGVTDWVENGKRPNRSLGKIVVYNSNDSFWEWIFSGGALEDVFHCFYSVAFVTFVSFIHPIKEACVI